MPGLIPIGEAADAVGNGVVTEPRNDKPKSSRHLHVEIWLHASAQVQRPEVDGRRRGRSAGRGVDGFQLPGAVDARRLASTLFRNAVRVRPSGSATKPSFSTRKFPM